MHDLEPVASIVNAKAHLKNVLNNYLVPQQEPETKDPKRMADGLAAVEVIMSVTNLFDALLNSGKVATTTAITDLTFGLNGNRFWTTHAGYLMPLINAGINAVADYESTKPEPLWDNLRYHYKYAWLEVIPAVIFCLLGPTEMHRLSDELKKIIQGQVK